MSKETFQIVMTVVFLVGTAIVIGAAIPDLQEKFTSPPSTPDAPARMIMEKVGNISPTGHNIYLITDSETGDQYLYVYGGSPVKID